MGDSPGEVKSLLGFHFTLMKEVNPSENRNALTLSGQPGAIAGQQALFLMIPLVFCCHYKSPEEIGIMIIFSAVPESTEMSLRLATP